MKHLLTCLPFISCLMLTHAVLGQPADAPLEKFKEDLRVALETKDTEKLLGLTFLEGISEEQITNMRNMAKHVFQDEAIEAMEVEPAPEDFMETKVIKGMLQRPNALPEGQMLVKYAKSASGSQSSSTFPYTQVDGKYLIVGGIVEKLDWTGPEDVQIGFSVVGAGQDDVTIEAVYNASGVQIARKYTDPTVMTWGQHWDAIVVTSTSPDTDVTLTVRRAGKEIYKSDPLKGEGILTYSPEAEKPQP